MPIFEFTSLEQKKIAEEVLGFPISTTYVKLPTSKEIYWLRDRITKRLMSPKLWSGGKE